MLELPKPSDPRYTPERIIEHTDIEMLNIIKMLIILKIILKLYWC